MHEALFLLKELDEADLKWILDFGTERQVPPGTIVIQEGDRPDTLFFVLRGLMEVSVASRKGQPLAKVGPGEVIGEITFLEGRTATATITTVEDSLLLGVSFKDLRVRLATAPQFAARWYKAFALILAQRLRDRVLGLTEQVHDLSAFDLVVSQDWAQFNRVIHQFKRLLHETDSEAAKAGAVSETQANLIVSQFEDFCLYLNRELGDRSTRDQHINEELGARVQIEMRPYVALTVFAERAYSKPRGYPGDFMTIEMIYQNDPKGNGWVGSLLDRCFLNTPAAKAVRNRRELMAEEIRRTCLKTSENPVCVTSLACGPASEVFDVLGSFQHAARLHVTLLDLDCKALTFVKEKAKRRGCLDQLEFVEGNLIYLALGRHQITLPPQDLIYSIGLIDYFNDSLVEKLLNYIYNALKPGGRTILGNFHPANTTRALMEHVLNWRLIHRSEEDINRLFAKSYFASARVNIRFEGEGINMFAECIKAPGK